MTFRIQRTATDDRVVLRVSGHIAAAHATELGVLLSADSHHALTVDLSDVTVVDRAGVLLLAGCEARGAILASCPGYVREWLLSVDDLRTQETAMLQEFMMTAGEGSFEGRGGLNIFFRSWRPNGAPRAVVAIVPGFNSHSGYYGWAAEQLVADGFATYALDLRGRGKSDGERFYVDTFEDYVDDAARFVAVAKSREPGVPAFLLGHSAGGVIACGYALDHQEQLAGLVCESFAFEVPAPDFVLAVMKGLSHIAPHAHVLRLKNEDFSRDPGVVSAMNADPLIAGETQPTRTVAAMVRADERLRETFPRITLPVLILHGTSDRATKPAGSQFFHETVGSTDKTLRLYDGHFHDLLNDVDRGVVMADIRGWIGARVPVTSMAK